MDPPDILIHFYSAVVQSLFTIFFEYRVKNAPLSPSIGLQKFSIQITLCALYYSVSYYATFFRLP